MVGKTNTLLKVYRIHYDTVMTFTMYSVQTYRRTCTIPLPTILVSMVCQKSTQTRKHIKVKVNIQSLIHLYSYC